MSDEGCLEFHTNSAHILFSFEQSIKVFNRLGLHNNLTEILILLSKVLKASPVVMNLFYTTRSPLWYLDIVHTLNEFNMISHKII